MRAALITARETIEIRELPEPDARPGAAVAAIERCGICGTDVAAWRSGDPYPPFLCGHEWVMTRRALDPDKLQRLGRYEVHLDQKLERMLAMLLRLRDLRQATITD